MAMGDVDGDVLWRQAQRAQAIDRLVIGRFDTQGNRGVQAFGAHVLDELHIVQVKTVHHIEVAVLRQPDAYGLVHHGFHIGRYHRHPKTAAA